MVLTHVMQVQPVNMTATAEHLAEIGAELAEEARETRTRAGATCEWAARAVAAIQQARAFVRAFASCCVCGPFGSYPPY